MDISTFSLQELSEKIQSKKISAQEATSALVEKIQRGDKKINSFITLNSAAINDAVKIDEELSRGIVRGPLAGVPVAIKDLLCTRGIKTTAGSKILENFIPPFDATVVERLKKAGAIIIGKTNLDEFAMGSSNENSAYGICRNPWNTDYVPGGSSGGSAAAVAARFIPAAIGTDTGGSIRQPASFCGIVGLKPTYGRVSRWGIIAFASSLDQAGPMTRTVGDAALLLEIIAGKDSQDMTSANTAVERWSKNLHSKIKGMRVGLPKEYFSQTLHVDVKKVVDTTVSNLKRLGAEFVEVSIPLTAQAIPIYYLICTSEASSNLARYDGIRYGYRSKTSISAEMDLEELYSRTRGEGFGAEVKRRIMLGTYALSSGYYDAYYSKACQVRRLLQQQYLTIFESCDVLLSPVTTSPAFKIGELISDPLEMYLNDILTTSTNLAGLPGMSVPAGFSSEGLPIGIQLTGPHFAEQSLFNVALAIEETAEVSGRSPDEL